MKEKVGFSHPVPALSANREICYTSLNQEPKLELLRKKKIQTEITLSGWKESLSPTYFHQI